MLSHVMSIETRVEAALQRGELSFHDLAQQVFPEDQYPRAWNYASHGGPPGCYMTLAAAVRRMGCTVSNLDRGPGRLVRLPLGHKEKTQ